MMDDEGACGLLWIDLPVVGQVAADAMWFEEVEEFEDEIEPASLGTKTMNV